MFNARTVGGLRKYILYINCCNTWLMLKIGLDMIFYSLPASNEGATQSNPKLSSRCGSQQRLEDCRTSPKANPTFGRNHSLLLLLESRWLGHRSLMVTGTWMAPRSESCLVAQVHIAQVNCQGTPVLLSSSLTLRSCQMCRCSTLILQPTSISPKTTVRRSFPFVWASLLPLFRRMVMATEKRLIGNDKDDLRHYQETFGRLIWPMLICWIDRMDRCVYIYIYI